MHTTWQQQQTMTDVRFPTSQCSSHPLVERDKWIDRTRAEAYANTNVNSNANSNANSMNKRKVACRIMDTIKYDYGCMH